MSVYIPSKEIRGIGIVKVYIENANMHINWKLYVSTVYFF